MAALAFGVEDRQRAEMTLPPGCDGPSREEETKKAPPCGGASVAQCGWRRLALEQAQHALR
uniref:hypothetical protein n=1 Tax=Xanthomonas sp. SHU 199 TaxID=1591174 RepID=UPI001E56D712